MVRLNVNGTDHELDADPEMPLLWALRDVLGLTGTKFGCGVAMCGACTVHVDGEAARSCALSIGDVEGSKVTTIEGLSPDGSHPLSYPILVQPVLDRHCVSCHNPKKPEGNVILTGEPAKTFSRSYNALVKLVSFSAWVLPNNNYEPLTEPDRFGARGSKLTKLLDDGHYDVKLSDQDWERLVTWMDANALFYGTFNPDEQARQLRGERIVGPDLE